MITGRPRRAARNVQRPARLEPPPGMIDVMHLRRVSIQPGFTVQHQRVRLPAVPQLERHLHELIGPVIPLVMPEMRHRPEIQRLAVIHGRHHVPRRPPARPPERWSSVANSRAKLYDASYVVDRVAPSPICRVTAASAPSSGIGSIRVASALPRRRQHQVLQHGKARERPHDLEGPHQPGARHAISRPAGDLATIEHHGPTVRPRQPANQIQQRGLPGTVRPDQPRHHPSRKPQRATRNRPNAAICLLEPIDAQQIHRSIALQAPPQPAGCGGHTGTSTGPVVTLNGPGSAQ